MIQDPDVWEEMVEIELANKFINENMNQVSPSDVTLLSLALADFTATTTFLVAHDYPVAGGLFVIGIVLIYLYHKFGSSS